MSTCPHCRHVLAARSCCGRTLLPPSLHGPNPTTNTASLSSQVPETHFIGAPLDPVSLCFGNSHQPLSLATPRISRLMFHFPSVQMPNPAFCRSPYHMARRATAHSQGTCSGMLRWPHLGTRMPAPTVTARMPTSGEDIVDERAEIERIMEDLHEGFNSMMMMNWTDHNVLSATRQALEECGWYWGWLSGPEAERLLESTILGTFLVRDSADARFLYSLTVQTERGPTSIRIQYTGGKFRLDCEPRMASRVPGFSHVISLIEHYIGLNRDLQSHVWVDTEGKMYSPITIRQPFKRTVPTLMHLSRLSINHTFHRSRITVSLPPALYRYVIEYPFWC